LWSKWISPAALTDLVWNAAPFLVARLPAAEIERPITLGGGPDGFLRILSSWQNMLDPGLSAEEQLQDYFALCLACHHASVATFVPTDVDTKIRGLLWRESRDAEVLRPMLDLALEARKWSLAGISTRVCRDVSGHDGEHWSVLAGALGRFLEIGDTESADAARTAIDEEIAREEGIFNAVAKEPGAEIDLLKVAMSLAHNRGDLTQGLSFWTKTAATRPVLEEYTQRGKFAAAVKLYQTTGMSAEGHRHYPLRPVKALRRSADLLLPLAPFLDEWGGKVARLAERSEVMEALVSGCRKIDGQQGYYRALAGLREADNRGFDLAAKAMSNGAQKDLRDPELRKRIDVPRASFESMMRKRARAAMLT
jgi:hypothetical protein